MSLPVSVRRARQELFDELDDSFHHWPFTVLFCESEHQ